MNEHQRRQQELQAQNRKFMQALSAGQAGACDRFSNYIKPGDRLLYRPPMDVIFDVVSVAPVLDPRVQPGMMDVVLTVTFPMRVPANQVNVSAIIIDNGAGKAAIGEQPPAGADAPPEGDTEPETTVLDPTPDDSVARLAAAAAQGDGDHGSGE